jgi:hypothetical protein
MAEEPGHSFKYDSGSANLRSCKRSPAKPSMFWRRRNCSIPWETSHPDIALFVGCQMELVAH